MSYLVLARKYRPQKFSDLIGQETTVKILQSAILQNRVASAYLFSGSRGTGKTTTARIFAKALNCQKAENRGPCDQCSSCQEITKGISLDVLELDAASHTQVDKIREVIIDTIAFAPVRDRYKVFIIDEAHMLSSHSFNALLKTLEEPPPHVVFILATTEFHRIPSTIVSRCQRFRFAPLTQQEILMNLETIAKTENIKIEKDALALIAKSASGAMRDALSLMDQIISHSPAGNTLDRAKAEEILGIVREDFLLEFIKKIADKDAKGVLQATASLLKEGYDLSFFLKELRESFREMLIRKCGFSEENALSVLQSKWPVDRFSLEQILRNIELLTKCADQMRWNDLPHLVFECFAVRLCQESLDLDQILERLKQLESGTLKALPQRPLGTVRQTPVAPPIPVPAPTSAPVVPAVPAPAPVLPPPSVPLVQVWQRLLSELKGNKPFLFQSLQSAQVRIVQNKVDLIFSKNFAADTVKRNLSMLEELIQKISGQKILIGITLNASVPVDKTSSANAGAAENQGPDELIVDSCQNVALLDNESFEVVESQPSAVENALEDEGVKKFLTHFHGKITRKSSKAV